MTKTFNPFKLLGSYLGAFSGYLFALKGIDAFGFLLDYLNFRVGGAVESNLVGGFIAGYTAHVFLRALISIGRSRSKKVKKMEGYKDNDL